MNFSLKFGFKDKMGKTQSKRSVDITTDPKKGPEEEVTGKMEKIEDVDQKEVNGDATIPEKNESEKKDAEECENDKDLTTEKSAGDAAKGGGDATEQTNTTAAGTTNDGETLKDEGAAGKECAAAQEEISPLADESIKKTKKDKVKKKWSFRSISFGKKDKQKPAKTEETAEAAATAAATTNGEVEKTPADGEAVEVSKKEEEGAGGDAETKPTENGEPRKTEPLNGEKSPTEIKSNETAENSNAMASSAVSSAAPTENDTQTESKAANVETSTATNTVATPPAEVVSNGTVDDTVKNGVATDIDADDAAINKAPESAVESNKSIPNVEEQPHQNGTNGDDNNEVDDEQQLKSTTKSHIEVNTITTHINSPTIVEASADKSLETLSQIPIINTTITHYAETSSSSDPIPGSKIQTVDSIQSEDNVQNELECVNTTPFPSATASEKDTKKESAANSFDSNTAVPITEAVAGENVKMVESSTSQLDDKTVEINAQNDIPKETITKLVEEELEENFCTETQLPPPLPVSPPPSQVSVFAFKNTETLTADDAVEETNMPCTEIEQAPANEISASQAKDANSEYSAEATEEKVAIIISNQKDESFDAEIESSKLPETYVSIPVTDAESQVSTAFEFEPSNQTQENEVEAGYRESEQLNVCKETQSILETTPIDLDIIMQAEINQTNEEGNTTTETEKYLSVAPAMGQTDLESGMETNEIKLNSNDEVLESTTELVAESGTTCKNDVNVVKAIIDEMTDNAVEFLKEKKNVLHDEQTDVAHTEIIDNAQRIETEIKEECPKEELNENVYVKNEEAISGQSDDEILNSVVTVTSTEVKKDELLTEGEINNLEEALTKTLNKIDFETNDSSVIETNTHTNTSMTKELAVHTTDEGICETYTESDTASYAPATSIDEISKENEIQLELEQSTLIKEEKTQSEDAHSNNVEEEKEINPKDLKEISTAELTTQKDLPVTCE